MSSSAVKIHGDALKVFKDGIIGFTVGLVAKIGSRAPKNTNSDFPPEPRRNTQFSLLGKARLRPRSIWGPGHEIRTNEPVQWDVEPKMDDFPLGFHSLL